MGYVSCHRKICKLLCCFAHSVIKFNATIKYLELISTFFVCAENNLPNSSCVEVEVTPPMNGTAGQEGEAVCHALTDIYYAKFNCVKPKPLELRCKGTET